MLIYFFSFHLTCILLRMDRKCKNNPYRFCYICGNVVLLNHQAKIPKFVKKAYHDYFRITLGDQDKQFAPNVCCRTCVENLKDWRKSKK